MGTPTEPSQAETSCEPMVGQWSTPVDGVRGRLATRREGDALALAVDIENVSDTAVEIHWAGPMHGFATFGLLDERGAEVPEPSWRLGGSEPGGEMRLHLPAHATSRTDLGQIIEHVDSSAVLRIGAFWARELPDDDARRSLHARIAGGAPAAHELLVVQDGDGHQTAARQTRATDPSGRVWTGPLELPSVCVSRTF